MAGACIAALLVLLAAPQVRPKGPGPSAEIVRRGEQVRQEKQPLRDADVRQLLRDWELFERAMATLHDSVPQIPTDGGSDADLAAAEAAWTADARVRRVLESGGTTPEAFLAIYRKTAEAWWELAEREARADSAAALRREIAALREVDDEHANAVIPELERGVATLERAGRPSADVALVRRHRDELRRIFSPAAAPPAP